MPDSVEREPLLQHDDDGFVRPDAWSVAKTAFGERGDIAMMLKHLERCTVASPRLLLAVAIHSFLSLNIEQQRQAVRDYLTAGNGLAVGDLDCGDPPPTTKADRAIHRRLTGRQRKSRT